MNSRFIIYCMLILGMISNQPFAAEKDKQQANPPAAILVVAPDRGFTGNEETRGAFAQIDHDNKGLVFITDERSRIYLDKAVAEFNSNGTREIAVLPMFISDHHPGWQLTRSWLEKDICNTRVKCRFARPFGKSYLAVDVLEGALHHISGPENRNLVLIGYGADNADTARKMAGDWQQIYRWTDMDDNFHSFTPFIWSRGLNREQQSEKLKKLIGQDNTAAISFHLGRKLDSMMSFDAGLRGVLQETDVHLHGAIIGSEITGLWMQRETNRSLMQGGKDVGVIVHAHGSDFHWNQTMREALEPLHSRYAVEYAFSMADRPSIESALMRLQKRGMRGAVLVRVFGRKDSFRDSIEKMIGMDVETGVVNHRHGGQHEGHNMPGGHGGESHEGHNMAGNRIRTPLVVTSFGGLEDHPLFAEALLDRAMDLSINPSKETIILVAHGTGDDGQNAAWLKILERLAGHMRNMGGDKFRDIKYATWREDWPDKRGKWIASVRNMVEKARENNGRAIVVPARTNAVGPEDEFLEGLDYVLGRGFAPHPLFAQWVESQIRKGIASLMDYQ